MADPTLIIGSVQKFDYGSFKINVNDPYNKVVRDAILNYTSGQQEINVSNLTQEAIRQAQQATQQGGGSGNSENPTSEGISSFNGDPNLLDSLDLEQAMKEQTDANFLALLNDFNTSPIIQSILNAGKDSPYLSVFSSEIAEQIANSYRDSYQTAQNLPNLQSKEDYQRTYADRISKINNVASFISDLLSSSEVNDIKKVLSETGKNIFDAASHLLNQALTYIGIIDIGAKTAEVAKLRSDFKSKYGVNIDDGIEIAEYETLIGLTQEVLYADPKIRDLDPKLFDKYSLAWEEAKWAKKSIGSLLYTRIVSAHVLGAAGAAELAGETATAAALVKAVAIGVIGVGCFQKAAEANDKAHYLNGVHLGEQPYLLTYIEQLLGWDYGSVETVKEFLSNPLLALYKIKNAVTSHDVENTPSGEERVFSSSADNSKLLNVKDNYKINAKTKTNEISNVGDHVTVNAGKDNSVANLGDHVEINSDSNSGNSGNTVVYNSGSNTKININERDNNDISNSADDVIITTRISNESKGKSQVRNGGKFVKIQLGNGTNDVENFGKDVTVNTGNGSDFIINYGEITTINAGSGNNVIYNSSGSNVSINTSKDNDYISVQKDSDRVTINAGDGSDAVINNGTKSLINLGAGNDYVYNDSLGNDATISGLDGDDTLENRAARVSINGGTENNNFVNDGVSVTMISGDGADVIANAGNAALINAGNGNNSIGNAGDTVSIFAGNGTDIIINEGNNVTINVVDGCNQITNKGSATSIIVGNGTNSINNYATDVTVSGGTGNDKILNGNSNVTLNGNKGSDVFVNYYAMQVDDNYYVTAVLYDGNNVLINGGDEGDHLENEGGKATLNGGDGDDTIINNGIFVVDKNSNPLGYSATDAGYLIDGGDGNDYVYNMNSNATIYGGQGNDTIELGSDAKNNVIHYKVGDGDNVIYGCNNTTTIKISGSDFSITQNGNDKVIKIGVNTIILKDTSSVSDLHILRKDEFITGTEGSDSIKNTLAGAIIDGLGGNDSIYNNYEHVSIDAGTGDDTVEIGWAGSDVSINAGVGDDSIENRGDSVTIDAGTGADTISNFGDNVTINAGDNNDIIYNPYGSNVSINASSGDDSIENGGDKVIIESGTGHDYIYNNSTNVTIDAGVGNDSIYNRGDKVIIDASVGEDYVESGGDSVTIDGGNGNDYIHNGGSNVTIDSGEGTDTIYNLFGSNVLINASSDDDSIFNGGDSVTINTGAGDDTVYNDRGSMILFQYLAGGGNDLIHGFNETSTLQIGNGNGSYSSTKSGADIIVTVGEGKITLQGATNLSTVNIAGKKVTPTPSTTKIYTNSDSSKVTLDSSIRVGNASKRTKAIKLTGNELDNSLLGGSGKDTLYGTDGNDSLVSNAGNDKLYGQNGNDTLWGGSGNDTLTGGDGDDLFIYSAGNDVISDYAEGDKISLSAAISKSSIKGSDATFTIGKKTLNVKNGRGKEIVFIDADGKDRTIIGGAYVATDSSSSNSTLASWREVGDATARKKAIKLTGNKFDNTILGGSGKDTLYGADGNDYLVGNAGNDKLYGQNNSDTLWGGAGNDTLTGGAGDDLFIYSAGNDFIADYATGDKISIGAAISKSSVKGSNATFTIGKNTLTVKNGKGKELVFIDAEGTERTIIGGAYLATDSSSSNSTLSSWREVGDASARTKAIKLTGNELDNSLIGGSGKDTLYGSDGEDYLVGNTGVDKLYGQNGDDTLWGGIGNDTLKGGDGADVFIYNADEGKDVISDFANDDMLQITGTFSATYNKSKKTIAFKVDSTASAITLKNFTATTFNVNGDTWKISGSKLVKK